MSLPKTPNVENSYILTEKHFTFPKKILDQIWKSFNTKFELQWKVLKSSYEEREILAIFHTTVALIFG